MSTAATTARATRSPADLARAVGARAERYAALLRLG